MALSAFALAVAMPQLVAAQDEPADDIVLPPTSAAAESTARYPEIAEAQQIILEGDLDRAVEKLKEACAKHDELSPARLILAQLLFSMRGPRETRLGRVVLEDVAVDHPEDPEAFMTLADIAIRDGRLAEAELSIAHAGKLLEGFDGNEERGENLKIRLLNYKAHLAESRGNWEEARDELQAWLAIDEEAAQAHYRLGIALFELGEYDAAFESLSSGASNLENTPVAAVMMGRLYERKDEHEKATEWMNRALKENPDDIEVILNVAQWMLQTRQYDKAQPLAERAVSQNPDSLEAKIVCGIIARFRGDLSTAERYFESAHLQSPVNFLASNNLALTLLAQENQAKLRRAAELAELNARQYNNPDAVITLGWAYYHLGRIDEANRLFQALLNSRQISADGLYYMAKVSEKRGKNDEARQQLSRALESGVPFANEQQARKLAAELGEDTQP